MRHPLNRRQFVSLSGISLIASRVSGNEADSTTRFEGVHSTMGTKFHTILYAHSEAQAKEALDTVATRLNSLNASLSDYVTSSEVSRLSASSGRSHWKLLHPDLEAVLSFGQRLSQQTDGAFDMTVGPLTRLWRHSRRHNKLPTKNRLRQALDATGHSNLILDSRNKRARLKRPSMRLDLGGIAKGYAVDEALATLKQLGITIALVNGGGDLRAAGHPPSSDGWRIAAQELDTREAARSRFVTDIAVATSGDLYQSLKIGNREFSHLIDPRTGLGLEFRRTVSVTAPSGMMADALASALSVLPTGSSSTLLSKFYPQASARILTQRATGIEEVQIHSKV
ncbi:MAG: FAD:protein FMN transferase [Verrucomicrobiales bacterium]|nr:FAD:protein FMN transferase [Verrucomicrobiaceae bacterium]